MKLFGLLLSFIQLALVRTGTLIHSFSSSFFLTFCHPKSLINKAAGCLSLYFSLSLSLAVYAVFCSCICYILYFVLHIFLLSLFFSILNFHICLHSPDFIFHTFTLKSQVLSQNKCVLSCLFNSESNPIQFNRYKKKRIR